MSDPRIKLYAHEVVDIDRMVQTYYEEYNASHSAIPTPATLHLVESIGEIYDVARARAIRESVD